MKSLYIYITIFIFLASCQSTKEEEGGHGHADEHEHEHTDEIKLTDVQMKTIDLQLDTFSSIKITDFVKASGILDLPPSSTATVHALQEGFMEQLNEYIVGSFVKKGATLATLRHPAYIEQQQRYLEIVQELDWLDKEVSRQKLLSEANGNALKSYQKAQSDLNIKTIQRDGLEQQLKYLGIDITTLKTGKIMPSIRITAPISGYVTDVHAHQGMFVKPEMELFQIIDNDHIHLELDIFERDLAKIKKGQLITFFLPALGNQEYQAEVHLISKSFNSENKTVRVHGHIKGKSPQLIQGLYADAKVWLNDATVNALPEKAVMRGDGQYYIYVDEGKNANVTEFRQVPVEIGEKENGMLVVKPIEVLPADAKIVTKGAFYLYAILHEGAHEH